MLLGLKRRMISRFLQSSKSKLTENQNIQEIQRCLEDGISFCRATYRTPSKVLEFNFKHKTSAGQGSFFYRITSNNEFIKDDENIFFHEAPNVLAEAVLTDIHKQAENYGKDHAMAVHQLFEHREYDDIPKKVPKNENVVVKLSNPDIDDPFNAAHLRRIMYGRFVANITKLFNKNVIFINYLHDWTLLEMMGDHKVLEIFQKYRNVCVGDHEKMYQKLGIKFDVTSAQSHYTEQSNQIMSMAKEKNLLLLDKETGQHLIAVDITRGRIPKYDDFSYYHLTYEPRDFAAIFDCFNKYSPDRIIHVSDSKKKYLRNLERIVEKLGSNQPGRLEFVCFDSAPLNWRDSLPTSDILDDPISKTTILLKHKLGEDCESLSDVSDKLNISRFAFQNFKRLRRYSFSSCKYPGDNQPFNHRDGATFQYMHARLCRLITLYSDDYSFESVDFNLLSEDCAIRLVQHLARYPEVLTRSYVELEASDLKKYLNTLEELEHFAYKELLVYNQPKRIRDTRLTLFKCTRQVLANVMNILGIQLLGKI